MSNSTGFKRSQYMNNDSFEFNHYKQDTPPTIEFHSHDFYEIYFFIDGTVTYSIEEKTFELINGDVLIIPPGKLHKPVITDGLSYERMVLWLNRDYIKNLDDQTPSIFDELKSMRNSGELLINLRGKNYKKALEMLGEIEKSVKSKAHKNDLICKSYIILFLMLLIKVSKEHPTDSKIVTNESIVPSIIEYINEHLTEPLTSDTIAEKFFISKYYLHHIFKDYTNVSLHDYIISKRIIYAKSLIRHGHNITDACFTCGFKDYSNFYKSFTAKTGISPKQFKNSFKNR